MRFPFHWVGVMFFISDHARVGSRRVTDPSLKVILLRRLYLIGGRMGGRMTHCFPPEGRLNLTISLFSPTIPSFSAAKDH